MAEQRVTLVLPEGLTLTAGRVVAFFQDTGLQAPRGENTLYLTGIGGIQSMSVWATEAGAGAPIARGARVDTLSVQLDRPNDLCRIVYRHDYPSDLYLGLQIIAG